MRYPPDCAVCFSAAPEITQSGMTLHGRGTKAVSVILMCGYAALSPDIATEFKPIAAKTDLRAACACRAVPRLSVLVQSSLLHSPPKCHCNNSGSSASKMAHSCLPTIISLPRRTRPVWPAALRKNAGRNMQQKRQSEKAVPFRTVAFVVFSRGRASVSQPPRPCQDKFFNFLLTR